MQNASTELWQRYQDVKASGAAKYARDIAAVMGVSEAELTAAGVGHDAVRLPQADYLEERGPFDLTHELALMRRHGTEILVTKNSGGAMTRAKIDAAQALGVPVLMVDRPALPDGVATAATVDDAEAWVRARR